MNMEIPQGTKIYDEMPEGWALIPNAMTAPKGYAWIWNGKSRFGGEYQQGLLKDERIPKKPVMR